MRCGCCRRFLVRAWLGGGGGGGEEEEGELEGEGRREGGRGGDERKGVERRVVGT